MTNQPNENRGITGISVSGFKSLRNESHIQIRNLTVISGANSSGKSSIMQPLLLLKQTSDASFDPGALRLEGPNVKFTSTKQFLVKNTERTFKDLTITIEIEENQSFTVVFHKSIRKRVVELSEVVYMLDDQQFFMKPDMSQREIIRQIPQDFLDFSTRLNDISKEKRKLEWRVVQNRYYLSFQLVDANEDINFRALVRADPGALVFEEYIRALIHVPGLRGNPERAYPITPVVGPNFQGTFENYTAAVISYWSEHGSSELERLKGFLRELGLTAEILTRPLDNTRAEIQVGRTLQSNSSDLVSIADVGFGVSQVLPILVALLVAEAGQLVYIEQPELHLHPLAQIKLAEIIVEAANRGVRVVVETHSDLLLLGFQTLVADEKHKNHISPEKIILHWFTRDDEGITQITTGRLNKEGAYGEWPEDFASVRFNAQYRYFDIAETTLLESKE